MMKKYSWIAALVLALSLAFFACDNGGGGKKGGGQQGGEEETLEWKTVWIMSEDDDIQALTEGPLSFAAGANPFKPLVRAGGDTDVTIKAVTTPDGTIGIEYTTIADWGAGVDLLHKEFGFRAGDKITILGEFLTVGGGYAQLNFRIGAEQSHGLKVEAAGPIEWEVELDAAMVGEIMEFNQYKDNPGLRIDGRSGGQVVRIDEIRIEGNRPTNIKTLAAPVIAETATGVSWAAVDGADGYEVYADDDVVATPGASATSVNLNAIDTLVVDQEYEITVVAKGVAGTSKDSVPSNAITYTHKLPSLPDIYQVPAAGADYFYINLNDFATSGAVNPNVPDGELAADKITLTFTEKAQRVNFKFTAAQAADLLTAAKVDVVIVGTTDPATSSFRYHIGNALEANSWNATATDTEGALSLNLTKTLEFGGNKNASTLGYFILQFERNTDNPTETEVVIESIKITILKDLDISINTIPLAAPAAGAAPVLTVSTAQYTGAVEWSPAVTTAFATGTVYTATITLVPATGYILSSLEADFFTVGGVNATNTAGSGVVTAVFPETDSAVANEVVVNNPVFVGWGGLGSAGENNTFGFVAANSYGNRITYTFPGTAASYDTIEVSYTVEELTSGTPANPMKLCFKNSTKDSWADGSLNNYVQHDADGDYVYTHALSDFGDSVITISHNTNNDESSDFTITITKIRFYNAD